MEKKIKEKEEKKGRVDSTGRRFGDERNNEEKGKEKKARGEEEGKNEKTGTRGKLCNLRGESRGILKIKKFSLNFSNFEKKKTGKFGREKYPKTQ